MPGHKTNKSCFLCNFRLLLPEYGLNVSINPLVGHKIPKGHTTQLVVVVPVVVKLIDVVLSALVLACLRVVEVKC